MDFVLPSEFIANAGFPLDSTQPLNALQWCDQSPCCSGGEFQKTFGYWAKRCNLGGLLFP